MTIDPGLAPRETTPDPKPAARIVDKNAGMEKVRREGRCRVTGAVVALTRFHLVGRDLGGDDVEDNIVPISHIVHMNWEHAPGGKRRFGPTIWAALYDWEKNYVLEKKGVDFVRRYYGVDLLGSPHPELSGFSPDCGRRIINRGAHYEQCSGPAPTEQAR